MQKILKSAVPLQHADDPQCAYLLQEVSIFNKRVIWYLEQQQKQEVFALGASGALWAYILQQGQSSLAFFLVAIPFTISAVLAVKSKILTQAMQESMSYLAALEERFEIDSDMGWVHFYRNNTSHYKKRWRRAFWSLLIIINMALAGIFFVFVSDYGVSVVEKFNKKQSSEYKSDIIKGRNENVNGGKINDY